MTSTLEDLGPCLKKLTLTVPALKIKEQLVKSFRELRNTVTIPGFRRGKTPHSLLEKRFGKEVQEDVKRDLVVQGIEAAVAEHTLDIVGEPELDYGKILLDPTTDLTFTVQVEVKPEFELPLYQGLEVVRVVKKATDEEVEKVITGLRDRLAEWLPIEDRSAQTGDLIMGDLELHEGDKKVWDTEEAIAVIAESGEVYGVPCERMAETFVGQDSGAEVSWTATLPAAFYVHALREKTVTVKMRIKELKRREVPPVDEELAKKWGAESVEGLRTKVKADIGGRYEHKADHDLQEALIGQIMRMADFPIPEQVVKRTIDRQALELAREKAYEMAGRGEDLSPDSIKAIMAESREGLRPEAEKAIRTWYLIEKIAKKEKIFATEDDFLERVENLARRRGKKTAEILKEIETEGAETEIRADILEKKVLGWLTASARIVDESGAAYTGALIDHRHDHEDHGGHDHGHDHGHEDHDEEQKGELA